MKVDYYFFLKASCVLILFFGCSKNKEKFIDKAIFANTWKEDILAKKNDCNKYIGSIENSHQRLAVINSLDSIFQTNQIKLKSLKISNWLSIRGFENRLDTESNVFYAIEINDNLYYQIRFERIRRNMYITKSNSRPIYYRNYNDVLKNDDVREFSFVHYEKTNKKIQLKESFIYCFPDNFLHSLN